jgi:hypothetical protein
MNPSAFKADASTDSATSPQCDRAPRDGARREGEEDTRALPASDPRTELDVWTAGPILSGPPRALRVASGGIAKW